MPWQDLNDVLYGNKRIAVETNILVYAHIREPREHGRANELIRGLAEGTQAWAIPWPCVYEFFSVVTHPRIWKASATTPEQAWGQLEVWLDSPTLRLLGEGGGFSNVLAEFARRPRRRDLYRPRCRQAVFA